jgi:hypothetical protein
MQKEWKKPTLEMLDVKMTMANLTGTHVDGEYSAAHPPQTVDIPGIGPVGMVLS